MNSYSLNHVIQELVEERSNATTGGVKAVPLGREEIYQSAWLSVNQWIESRLKSRKGAELSVLGKFTWEFKKEKGEINFRPIFILGSAFSKEHHIRTQRSYYNQLLAPSEEINFSKLAIKFSKKLTKDLIFASIRDIIKKIGEFIDRFYEIQIEFSFGILKSKQRKVNFEFNLAKIQQLLPEDSSHLYMPDEWQFVDDSDSEPINSIMSPTPRTPLSPMSTSYFDSPLSSKNISPTSALLSTTNNENKNNTSETFELNLAKIKDDTKQVEVTNISSPPITPTTSVSSITPSATATSTTPASIDKNLNTLSPRTQQILMTLDKPVESRGKSHTIVSDKRNKVQEQAFIDTITDIQNKAKEVDRTKYMEHIKNVALEKSLKVQREKHHYDKLQLQSDLDNQIEFYHKKMNDERIARREGRVVSILNDDADGRPAGSNGKGPTIRELRKEIDGLLLQQIETNASSKIRAKENKAREEQLFLDHIAMEADMQMIRDRVDTLEKQKDLLEQWERQSHLRNLKKLESTSFGDVAVYLDKNLPDLSPSKKMQSSSIGFDFRKK